MKNIKIGFLDFWGDFDSKNNFFSIFFQEYFQNIKVVNPIFADIIIFGPFKPKKNKSFIYKNRLRIFYTGEPVDINDYDFDYSLSFDEDSKNNFRLPLWMLYIDWFSTNQGGINKEHLFKNQKNLFAKKNKNLFCSFVYSQNNYIRETIFQNVNSKYKVDRFGRLDGFKNIGYTELDKLNVISNYKFNLAIENTLKKGYVTEKLLQALFAGCIPIYYGSEYAKKDFNSQKFIYIDDFSEESYIENMLEILNSHSLYNKMRNEPIFNTIPNLDNLYKFIKSII